MMQCFEVKDILGSGVEKISLPFLFFKSGGQSLLLKR